MAGAVIEIVEAAPHATAVAKGRADVGKVGEQFMPLLDKVWAVVRTLGVEPIGHNVAVYSFRDNGLDLEVGVQVAHAFDPVGDVVSSWTPGGRCLRTLHKGPYDGIRAATDAVIAYAHQHGHKLTGVSWEVYGDWNDDPSKLETWIHFALA